MSEIENVKITSADLSMADHGCLTLALGVEGQGWFTIIGGYSLGHGYLGATTFKGSPKGTEEIMQIMNVVGVERFSDLKGKYIRVETNGNGPIKRFGHIIEDKWFDYREFYKKESDK